ncbi:hypothetical protein [Xanthomonas medicagonis]|uniref:hypothetical protein n=1 Tax=Xanthomonas medicagonis TaxID=3160841 RepID=UPI003514EA88
MSGLLWKLAVAGGVVAAVRAYRRRTNPQQAAAFSHDGAYRAVPDDGSFTPPHGDVVSVSSPPQGDGNGAGLHTTGPAMS